MLLREGHVLPTLNLLYNYEENVGHDEDVRTEALRIVELTSDPEGVGQFLERALEKTFLRATRSSFNGRGT